MEIGIRIRKNFLLGGLGSLLVAAAFMGTPLFAHGARDMEEQDQSAATDTVLPAYPHEPITGDPVPFHEIWGYVMQTYNDEFSPDMPLTDVCLFAADINSYGELTNVPPRDLISGYSGRVHLVVCCDSISLTHFVIDPEFPVRAKLIKQIANASNNFNGVQIDFELVTSRDRDNFISFITDLKTTVQKPVSVCVPARIRDFPGNVYPYVEISKVADRVIVMAYDEHWATSSPGPVASLGWCGKVADHATATIPMDKLVMGMPFYGRTWVDHNHARGWYYSSINRVMKENNIDSVDRVDSVPTFTYKATTTVTGWFEDSYSLVQKCRLYQSKGICNAAFWRVGQEDPDFWRWLSLN